VLGRCDASRVHRSYIRVVAMVATAGPDPLPFSATSIATRLRKCVALAWLVGAVAAGCRPHHGHVAPAGVPSQAPVREVVGWRSLNWEDRHDTMTFAVLPEMGRLFQRFRASESPDLTCRSCHGPDGEERAYRMPHGLPPLDSAALPEGRALDAELSRTVAFMHDEVTPTMAEILEMPVGPPETVSAFSCFNCHPRAEAKGTPP